MLARVRSAVAPYALALVPLAFLLVVLVAPAVRLVVQGWEGAQGGQGVWSAVWVPWQDPYLRWRMAWSFVQAGATCVASLLLGLPVAWVLARFDFAGRTLILRCLMLPFVVPTLVP